MSERSTADMADELTRLANDPDWQWTNGTKIRSGVKLTFTEAAARLRALEDDRKALVSFRAWFSLAFDVHGRDDESMRKAACDAINALEDEKAQAAAKASRILEGFKLESMNGVVCSIPDTGIGTLTHRTWCANCKRRYQELELLANAALSAPPVVPAPSEPTCTCPVRPCGVHDFDPPRVQRGLSDGPYLPGQKPRRKRAADTRKEPAK